MVLFAAADAAAQGTSSSSKQLIYKTIVNSSRSVEKIIVFGVGSADRFIVRILDVDEIEVGIIKKQPKELRDATWHPGKASNDPEKVLDINQTRSDVSAEGEAEAAATPVVSPSVDWSKVLIKSKIKLDGVIKRSTTRASSDSWWDQWQASSSEFVTYQDKFGTATLSVYLEPTLVEPLEVAMPSPSGATTADEASQAT
jgi:hypothetical protein